MNISKKILNKTKIKLLYYKDILEYTIVYLKTYDSVCSLTTKDLELLAKKVFILLQTTFFTNIGLQYTNIVFTIELE